MTAFIVTVFFSLYFVYLRGSTSAIFQNDQMLLRDIFRDYNSDVSPQHHPNKPLHVDVVMLLIRLDSLNEKEQSIQTKLHVCYSWNDPRLRWNPPDYNSVQKLTVRKSILWTPPIVLINRASLENGDTLETQVEELVSITSDGNCTLSFAHFYKSTCEINVSSFPFDQQTCELWFGSWSMDKSMLILHNVNTNASSLHQKNGEWRLKKALLQNGDNRFGIQRRDYSILIITCELERKYFFYVMNLLLPCALLASMTFLVFMLPVKSGERISLSITVMLSMAIFQELSSAKLPSSSDNYPIFGIYYSTSMLEIGFALIINCVILNIYYREDKMPSWLRNFVLGKLARIVFVSVPERIHEKMYKLQENNDDNNVDRTMSQRHGTENGQNIDTNSNTSTTAFLDRSESFMEEHCVQTNDYTENKHRAVLLDSHVSSDTKNDAICRNDKQEEVSFQAHDENEKEKILEEWRLMSRVIDRIMFSLATFIGVSSALSIFFQAERFKTIFTGD